MGSSNSRSHHINPPFHPPFPNPPALGQTPHTPVASSTMSQRLRSNYDYIPDNYNSLEQVQNALRQAGLESSNLIVGVDFTKSNEWTGKHSFGGRSLHSISANVMNPYETAVHIIGRTLSPFDDDNLIPCYGFGDSTTHDRDVFSFYSDNRPCNGFEDALARYRFIAPHLRLAGPTSFAPVIEAAVRIVEESGGQFHVLLIIADGQVTRSVDTAAGHLSVQEQSTIDAIVAASNYALSIVMVGVGDGPWDMMYQFDDNVQDRNYDNFQFVNFSEIMKKQLPPAQLEAQFALAALMEIPLQYRAAQELNLVGRSIGRIPPRRPLPPPPSVIQADASPPLPNSNPFASPYPSPYAPSAPTPPPDANFCPICLTNTKDLVFGCGHQTCRSCGESLQLCPICRAPIATRIRLYS